MRCPPFYPVVLMVAVLPAAGRAETATSTTLAVDATVLSACQIHTEPLGFSALASSDSTALNGEAALRVRCTRGTDARVRLDSGRHPHPDEDHPRMTNDAGQSLGYGLMLYPADAPPPDPGRKITTGYLRGDGRAHTWTLGGRLDHVPESPGLWSDTLTITLVY